MVEKRPRRRQKDAMTHGKILGIWGFTFALTSLAACSGATGVAAESKKAPVATGTETRPGPNPGEVILGAASQAYVKIEAVSLEPEHAVIRAPARAAFRDGAVSKVGAPIPGRVMKLHVEAGDRVKVGDALVTIASPEASGFHMDLARARIELDAAKDNDERQTQMVAKGVGREYEKVLAKHQVDEVQAQLRHAQKAVSLLGKSTGGTVVVTSQIEGTVLRRYATPGAQVTPNDAPLVEIGNPNDLWVVAEVFQDDLQFIKEGSKVTLEFASFKAPIPGHVEAIGVLVDTGLRRAPVYVKIDNGNENLTPGMFARANIQAPAEEGVTVPKGAVLIKDGSTTIVYVEQGDHLFARREVLVGYTFGEFVQILSGLKAGEHVAVEGALLLDATAQQLL
jgi:cobalt-zinc-cadmium efflux system membrane fusion protein